MTVLVRVEVDKMNCGVGLCQLSVTDKISDVDRTVDASILQAEILLMQFDSGLEFSFFALFCFKTDIMSPAVTSLRKPTSYLG